MVLVVGVIIPNKTHNHTVSTVLQGPGKTQRPRPCKSDRKYVDKHLGTVTFSEYIRVGTGTGYQCRQNANFSQSLLTSSGIYGTGRYSLPTLQPCIPHLVHVRNCAELLGVGLDQGVELVRVTGHAVLEEAGTLQELGQGAGPRASTFTYSYSYRYIRPELVGTVPGLLVGSSILCCRYLRQSLNCCRYRISAIFILVGKCEGEGAEGGGGGRMRPYLPFNLLLTSLCRYGTGTSYI